MDRNKAQNAVPVVFTSIAHLNGNRNIIIDSGFFLGGSCFCSEHLLLVIEVNSHGQANSEKASCQNSTKCNWVHKIVAARHSQTQTFMQFTCCTEIEKIAMAPTI